MTEETLEEFIEEIAGESHLRVEKDLGDGFVRLKSDEAQRRQAIQDIRCVEDAVIELLRNSRDAHASELFLAVSKEEINREITLIDNGCGVPQAMYDMIFEPRVTSKLDTANIDKWGVHGRGMALYSIRYNANEAYVVDSLPSGGAAIKCVFDTTKLREKSDQSSFPTFARGELNTVNVSGPRNILRNSCEFALEHRDALTVFVGSQTEIAATLYSLGVRRIPFSQRCEEVDFYNIALCDRLSYCVEPTEFCSVAESLGLSVSGRTAMRIMNGEIKPLLSLSDMVKNLLSCAGESMSSADKILEEHSAKPRKHGTSVSISKDDLASLRQHVVDAYQEIASRYYLQESPEIVIKKTNNALTITIELRDNEEECFE